MTSCISSRACSSVSAGLALGFAGMALPATALAAIALAGVFPAPFLARVAVFLAAVFTIKV